MIPGTSAMDKPVAQPRGAARTRIVCWSAVGAAVCSGSPSPCRPRRWARADRAVDATRLRFGSVLRGDLERDVSAQGRIVAALHPTLFSPAAGHRRPRGQGGHRGQEGPAPRPGREPGAA